jgi:hypothetical protein
MLPEQIPTTGAQGITQCERSNQHIIELTRNRDEVGDKVDRHREVGNQEDKDCFSPSRNTGVSKQPPQEDQTVRNETGKGPRLCSPPGEIENNDENEIEDESSNAEKQGPRDQGHAFIFAQSWRDRRERFGRLAAAAKPCSLTSSTLCGDNRDD